MIGHGAASTRGMCPCSLGQTTISSSGPKQMSRKQTNTAVWSPCQPPTAKQCKTRPLWKSRPLRLSAIHCCQARQNIITNSNMVHISSLHYVLDQCGGCEGHACVDFAVSCWCGMAFGPFLFGFQCIAANSIECHTLNAGARFLLF